MLHKSQQGSKSRPHHLRSLGDKEILPLLSKPVFYFGGFCSLLFPHYFSIFGKWPCFWKDVERKNSFFNANCSPVPKNIRLSTLPPFLTAAYKGPLKKRNGGDWQILTVFCVVKTAPDVWWRFIRARLQTSLFDFRDTKNHIKIVLRWPHAMRQTYLMSDNVVLIFD